MSTSAEEKTLFQEMKTLAQRYGVNKCQNALNEVKIFSSRTMVVNRKCPREQCFDLSNRSIRFSLEELIRWIIFGYGNQKLSLQLSNDPPGSVWGILGSMEKYHDELKHGGNPRVESRFHTLFLNATHQETVERVLEYKKCIALFDVIDLWGLSDSTVGTSLLDRIKDLVVDEGVISSLKVSYDNLREDQALQLGEILEGNFMESMVIQSTSTSQQHSPNLGQALIQSLNLHVHTFTNSSMLRALDIHNALDDMDAPFRQNVLQTIGRLPSLESFGITTKDPNVQETLAGCIGSWTIRHFKLYRRGSNENTDFQPLFASIARSRCLRKFTFSCVTRTKILPPLAAQQIVELALLSTSGLLNIDLFEKIPDLALLLGMPVPNDMDSKDRDIIPGRGQLRRFDFVQGTLAHLLKRETDHQVLFAYLTSLVRLLSSRLPYLHSIGLTMDNWRACQDHFVALMKSRIGADEEIVDLWRKVWVQIEMNRVGMALLEPILLHSTTIPSGLWPIVLNRAMEYDPDPQHLPWTGIYLMVRQLVMGGHTRWWSEGLEVHEFWGGRRIPNKNKRRKVVK